MAAAAPDVVFAYLFGSAATGRRKPGDVDLAVYVRDEADRHQVRLDVAQAASKHLGTDAIDVVPLNAAPVSLAGRILTSRRVLIDRQPFVRHLYESRVARSFQDFRIREHRLLERKAARG